MAQPPAEAASEATAPALAGPGYRVYTEEELCPKYGTHEGCEDDPCSLGVHPVAPNGTVTKRVCDYYLSERGCAKAERCDFLHCYGKVKAKPEAPSKPLCSFYFSPKGCIKEDRCDFLHPKAPDGSTTLRVCEYFQSARGCAKDARCDFLHVEKQHLPATALVPDRMGGHGGRGGAVNMGMPGGYGAPHPGYGAPQPGFGGYGGGQGYGGQAAAPVGPLPARPTKASEKGNTRVCTFYSSPRGCAKGERCDFVHAASTGGGAGLLPSPHAAPPASDPHAAAAYGAYGQQAAYGAYAGYDMSQYAAAGYGAPAAGYGAPAAAAGYGAYGAYGASGGGAEYGAAPPSAAPQGGGGSSGRVCSFFSTPRGCIKGDRCEFVHPAGAGGAPPKSSARYSPY